MAICMYVEALVICIFWSGEEKCNKSQLLIAFNLTANKSDDDCICI